MGEAVHSPAEPELHVHGADFQHLPRRTLLAYGVSALPLNFYGTFLGVHLIFFYTDTVGLAPIWITIGMISTTLWDAISDPLMGVLSDRTPWRWGRRRPYILLGMVPLGLSFFALLAPPTSLGGNALGWYFTGAMFALYTFRTIVETPIGSLAPELAQAYHERTRLASHREALGNVGDLCGLLSPLLLMLALIGDRTGDAAVTATRVAFRLTGGAACFIGVVGFLLTYMGTYEDPTFRRDARLGFRRAARAVLQNRAFLILLVSSTLVGMGLSIVNGMFRYVLHYIMEADEKVEILAFVTNAVGALSSYPFWVWFSKRYGKPAAFRIGLFTSALTFCSVFVLHKDNALALYFIMAFAGIANVGVWMLLFTLNADVIDVDELETGLRREGLYAGFGSFIRKTAIALGTGSIGIGLSLIGYQANGVQSPETMMDLKLLFALPTTLMVLAAFAAFWFFPLTRDRHAKIMEQLHARRLASGVAHEDEARLTDE